MAVSTSGVLPGWGHTGYERAYAIALGDTLCCLAAAEVCFVIAFRARVYRVMNVQAWTNYEPARLPPVESYIELAGEYKRTISENRQIGGRKAPCRAVWRGAFCRPSSVSWRC